MAKKKVEPLGPPTKPPPLRLEWRSPSELADNPRNWRRHPEAQIAALSDVISEVGWAGACLFNERTGRLVDGHARQKVALAQGAALVPVLIGDWSEADEAKILATLDPLAAMAEADSVALDALLRDVATGSEAVAKMLDELAQDAKLYIDDKDEQGDTNSTESQYTNKITAPIYEPKGERPPISDLSDKTKTNELCDEIEKAELPDEVRGFLLTAAQRHTVFNFRNIAEFYCHASVDVQHLMERSGLIIIDMGKAIANGFVHLSERLGAIADLELSEAEDA